MGFPKIPWDSGMGWTVGCTRICERDRWTSHGISYGPMGSWDRMDSGTHMQGLSYGPMGSWDGRGIHTQLREGQLDIPWNVPWDHGMGSGIRTQLREGQFDIPWNVPRSHGAVGWDGLCDTHI